MANEYYENQYALDTAGGTLLKYLPGANPGSLLRVKAIQWVGATTAGHQMVIQREDGKVYFEAVAAGANHEVFYHVERSWQKDFKLTTLGSGRVYIFLFADKF